jgi:stage IV sporulation protein FB
LIYLKFKNLKLGISFWFAVFCAAALAFDRTSLIWCSLFAAFIHEGGHILALAIKGMMPPNINIRAFNIDIIDDNRIKREYRDDIFVLLFGAIMNLLFFVVFFTFYLNFDIKIFYYLYTSNLIIGVFNLLPISALDGGQILYAVLLNKTSVKVSKLIVNICSFIFLIPIMIAGLLVLFESKYNFSLLAIGLYLFAILLFKRDDFY